MKKLDRNGSDAGIQPGGVLNSTLGDLATFRSISHIVGGRVGVAVAAFGVAANLLSLVVLRRPNMRNSSTNLYLAALAAVDTLVLLSSIAVFAKDTRDSREPLYVVWQDFAAMPYLYIYSHAASLMFQVASVWLTVAFSADRYVMICHPFLAERHCNRRLVAKVIVGVLLCSCTYTLPRVFEQEIFNKTLPYPVAQTIRAMSRYIRQQKQLQEQLTTYMFFDQQDSVVWYHTSDFGLSLEFRLWYHLVSWLVLVVAVPLCSIAVMNFSLVAEIRRVRHRGRRLGAASARRHDTNMMLLGVICLFFVCQIPAAVAHLMWSIRDPADQATTVGTFAFREVANVLVVANSALNIVPYCLCSCRFRRELLQVVACRRDAPPAFPRRSTTPNTARLLNRSLQQNGAASHRQPAAAAELLP